jgi:hypothetical protein
MTLIKYIRHFGLIKKSISLILFLAHIAHADSAHMTHADFGQTDSSIISQIEKHDIAEDQYHKALIIKQGASLRDVISTIARLQNRENVYYDLDNVQYTYKSDRDQIYSIDSLISINNVLNTHYQLNETNKVYLHEKNSILIVTNKTYKGQLHAFEVQASNLFDNIVRLATYYGWKVDGWPFSYHYLIETKHPIVIDSLESGLRKLLSNFPIQAQIMHNTRNINLVPRLYSLSSELKNNE